MKAILNEKGVLFTGMLTATLHNIAINSMDEEQASKEIERLIEVAVKTKTVKASEVTRWTNNHVRETIKTLLSVIEQNTR